MKQQTFEQARAAADAYLAADAVARRAEADKLLHLAELAESYSVHDPEVMVQVLVEGFISIGGEGTPKVSEFLALEAAGLMGCSPSTAAGKLADILDLKHRHQFLWQAVQDLTLESWKGLYAAHRCRALDRLTADTVANTWLESQEGLAWSAAKDLLDQLIVALDPDAAAQKEALALTERRVDVWDHQHGTLKVTARLSALDARYLDAAVDQFAGVLERIHLADDDHLHFPLESKDELRSASAYSRTRRMRWRCCSTTPNNPWSRRRPQTSPWPDSPNKHGRSCWPTHPIQTSSQRCRILGRVR